MLPAEFATTEKFAFLVRHSRLSSSSTTLADYPQWVSVYPMVGERLDQFTDSPYGAKKYQNLIRPHSQCPSIIDTVILMLKLPNF